MRKQGIWEEDFRYLGGRLQVFGRKNIPDRGNHNQKSTEEGAYF